MNGRSACARALCAWLVLLGGCRSGPLGDDVAGSGGSGGVSGGAGGDGGSGAGGGALEYGPCFPEVPGSCAAPLVCASVGVTARCAHPCTPPDGACPGARLCLPQYEDPSLGYCAEQRDMYATCEVGDVLSACRRDAYCLSQSTAMPDRCVPICEAGTLGEVEEVLTCPELPAELGGGVTSCLPITVETAASGSLCSVEAAVGARCDQATWRCDLEGVREDTDPAREPAAAGEADPGALGCLPQADGAVCARICSDDGGATAASPCACPVSDPLCLDPPAELAWGCVGWTELGADVRACVWLEDCTADDALCADNLVSGFTACVDTPYDGPPTRICAPPP